MEIDPSIRNADDSIIALMAIILAGVVGLIGFVVGDHDIDLALIQPLGPPAAALVSTAKQVAVDSVEPRVKPFEETWHAVESASGARPDAAH